MRLHETIQSLARTLEDWRHQGKTVGFVPTMGALHAGHLSLIDKARKDCDVVVLSIFVNPLQFAPHEDLDRYPRAFEADRAAAFGAGVDELFAPSAAEMYPEEVVHTRLNVPVLSTFWEGRRRPTHFAGMATVVAKLLNIVGPCSAYFGEKDWQQLAIIRRFVHDLSMPVKVVGCPIIREPDGLAMSSRNAYLSNEERQAALTLFNALKAGQSAVEKGERDPIVIHDSMMRALQSSAMVKPHYAAVVDETLTVPHGIKGRARLLVAANVGVTSLIDNVGIEPSSTPPD